jgi:ferritin
MNGRTIIHTYNKGSMQTGRLKTFDFPHRGLRNALGQFSLLAGTTNYDEPAQVETLAALGRDIFRMLDVHAHSEDAIVLIDLEMRLPGASERNCNEHGQIEKKQKKVEQALEVVRAASEQRVDVAALADHFRMTLYNFHAAYLRHMAVEEQETQPLLWQYFTDDELFGHHKQIVGSMTPDMLLLWIRFMTPALNAPERTTYIGAMKEAAPAEQFAFIMEFLRRFLGEQEWNELAESLEYEAAAVVS